MHRIEIHKEVDKPGVANDQWFYSKHFTSHYIATVCMQKGLS